MLITIVNRVVTTRTIHPSRIRQLNTLPPAKGDYVLYWMQQSQRAADNHALEYAVQLGNAQGLPVLVCFGLTDDYPDANLRHYTFMLEGLRETQKALAKRRVRLVVRFGAPAMVAQNLGRKASVIVCDCGHLAHQREWRRMVAKTANCSVYQVETDVVVPVETVSAKAQYAARTIRPRIQKHLPTYLIGLAKTPVKYSSLDMDIEGLDVSHVQPLLGAMKVDMTVGPVSLYFPGGTSRAKKRFAEFLKGGLSRYEKHSNQPQTDDVSHMSPYLHFGQVSSLRLALEAQKVKGDIQSARAAYLEELIVRRELACNFVRYTPHYDRYAVIPPWARKTLAVHQNDKRPVIYTVDELEQANTHDIYWNAAMKEMKVTGFMHNYMRMYWGKKILEWSRTPEEAFQTTLALNNKYFLDGRDPNSYAGVAWLYGVHDRAWAERPIFGKVRYMAASGLERKCDIQAYVRKVDDIVKQAERD